VVRQEEKSKSLQQLFKELNNHTANSFEYGKTFLAYLLTTSKKVRNHHQHHHHFIILLLLLLLLLL
jgi:hypothetical protein